MEKVRIDKYLWSIRIFKTRSLATDACNAGKVKLGDEAVKASKQVMVGEQYAIKTEARFWLILVNELLVTRKSYSEAIRYYTDITPEEDIQVKEKITESFYTGKRLSKTGKPTKKQRRDRDDFFDL